MLGKALVLAWAQPLAPWALNVSLLLSSPICAARRVGTPCSPGHVFAGFSALLTWSVGMGWEAKGAWKPSGISSSPAAPVLLSAIHQVHVV